MSKEYEGHVEKLEEALFMVSYLVARWKMVKGDMEIHMPEGLVIMEKIKALLLDLWKRSKKKDD